MRKVYRLKDLDCANCAAKMERAIQKLDGVCYAEINFMAQKLVVEAEEKDIPEILRKAQACISKIERNCKIVGI